jgi:hypothetical protein
MACSMRPIPALFLFVGLAVAGAGLGVLVSFERRLDNEVKALNSGLAIGLGVALALFALLASRDRD